MHFLILRNLQIQEKHGCHGNRFQGDTQSLASQRQDFVACDL
ncbi:hypothetical protein [Planctomicrobium sp. SH527]